MRADRKIIEKYWYDSLYADGAGEKVKVLRCSLLEDSEKYFEDRLIDCCKGKTVLEIGCGLGRHLGIVAGIACQATGVDISEKALEHARALLAADSKSVILREMDAEALSFENETFDVVINHEVFSSVNPERCLSEIARVLKPDGIAVCKETYGHNSLFNFIRWLNVITGRRTKWAAAHIWSDKYFEISRRYFQNVQISYFHILAPICVPVLLLPNDLRKKCIRFISYIDRKLTGWRKLQKLSFKVVFELRK